MQTFLSINHNPLANIRSETIWFFVCAVLAFALCTPLFSILWSLFSIDQVVWQHLLETVLWDYISQSMLLCLGVSLLSVTIGVVNAWLISMCMFPGRRIFEWALLLPMAMPAYIIAYTYTGVLDEAGPVQQVIRNLFGLQYGDYWFPEIRSLGGAIIVLSLVLYPYVYLLVRAAFMEQSNSLLQVSRTLGCSISQAFFRVALRLARPAIVVGWSLVMMETLADYGTVQYFGISTFTTGIFRTWFGLGNHLAAAQLSAILLMFVFVALTLEQAARKNARYYQSGQTGKMAFKVSLNSAQSLGALLMVCLPVLFGFVIPVYFLVQWAWLSYQDIINEEYKNLIVNSFFLASITSLISILFALLLAYSHRLLRKRTMNLLIRLAGLGYAIPGAVIAVGVLIPLSWLDKRINIIAQNLFDLSPGLILSGSVFILFFAYLIRFLSISLNSAVSSLGQIKPNMDESARLQGVNGAQLIRRVHLPLMSSSLISAAILVFVDVLKELPATLILRPFNFNTLAIRAYELANDERLIDAAVPSLTIVLVGLIPVILLSRSMQQRREKEFG